LKCIEIRKHSSFLESYDKMFREGKFLNGKDFAL